jgi:hypothetical protein
MAMTAVPELVRRHAERAIGDTRSPAQVVIRQEGEMWLRPGSRAMRFTAKQLFSVDAVAFNWRARFPLLGPLALQVVDRYASDDGELAVRLFGVPLQRQRGPEAIIGEALRYLAELPWVPHGMLANRQLEWRELDERRVEVAAQLAGQRVVAELQANEQGDFVSSSSRMRKRETDGAWVETPWGGEFGDYDTLGGVRVPTRGEAHWELPEGRYTYFRGRVTSLQLLD